MYMYAYCLLLIEHWVTESWQVAFVWCDHDSNPGNPGTHSDARYQTDRAFLDQSKNLNMAAL